MVLDGSDESDDGDPEEEHPAGRDPADDGKGVHVRGGLAVRRHADQDEAHELETKSRLYIQESRAA